MNPRVLLIAIATFLGCVACGPSSIGAEWKLRVRVEFVESDFKTPRPALARDRFYLAFPFIGGDFYGTPTTKDYSKATVDLDYSFVLDLTNSEHFAGRAVRPAGIGEGRVHGTPDALGLARVATFTRIPHSRRRAGFTAWADANSDGNLVLAYFDRPGRIVGSFKEDGHEHRYNISVDEAGYAWLRREKIADNVSEMVVSEWPRDLVLRVAPLRD
jgi:hypothetical protein